jgi:hypothetical protein
MPVPFSLRSDTMHFARIPNVTRNSFQQELLGWIKNGFLCPIHLSISVMVCHTQKRKKKKKGMPPLYTHLPSLYEKINASLCCVQSALKISLLYYFSVVGWG